MSKIKFENLNEAVVKTNNSVDSERVYDIEANARILNGNEVSYVDNGFVRKDGDVRCTFSTYQKTQMNMNFQNISDVNDMCEIAKAVSEFVANVEDSVKGGDKVVINE